MTKPKNIKEKQEESLLNYIDIPYFRNNPTYIDRWRTYFQRYKDPQILLLMYHKQISTFYHWIYLELSQHFLSKKQPQIAYFVLNEALKNNVYDSERIKEALNKIPPFEKKYSKGDMLALLNMKNIQALGKTWNVADEVYFYLKNPPKDAVNHEIEQIKRFERNYQKIKNELIISNSDEIVNNIDNNINEENTKDYQNDVILNSFNNDTIEDKDSVAFINNNNIKEAILENNNIEMNCTTVQNLEEGAIYSSSFICTQEIDNEAIEKSKKLKINNEDHPQVEFLNINGNLEVNNELIINQSIYIIQKIHDDYIELLKIAKEINITETFSSKSYCLRKCSYLSCVVFKEIDGFDICKSNGDYYLLYEFNKICDLKSIILTASESVKCFYLKRVIEKTLRIKEEGYLLNDPLDFFIDQDFDLGFNCVELRPINQETLNQTLSLLKSSFLTPEDVLTFDLNMISKLNQKSNNPVFKKEILKHKTDILQSM